MIGFVLLHEIGGEIAETKLLLEISGKLSSPNPDNRKGNLTITYLYKEARQLERGPYVDKLSTGGISLCDNS